jgi:hypothetical protein
MAIFESSHSNPPSLSEHFWAVVSSGRVSSGLLYGALLGTIYALVSQTIDLWLMTDVPLAVNWNQVIIFTITTALSGAALGLVSAAPHETWRGVLAGAVAIALWGLLRATLLTGSMVTVLLLPTLLPLVVLGLPISGLMRWAVNWHTDNTQHRGFNWLRSQGVLLSGVVAVAAFAGSWSQMQPYAQDAVRQVDRILQFAISNSDKPLSVTLKDVPDINAHLASRYVLVQRPVDSSATGVEVTVLFEDNYGISCVIGQAGDTPICKPGKYVFSNPGGSK